MYLLWEESRQKGLKVAKYCAKVTLVCVRRGELMAAGGGYCCGPPQINQRMGNTGGCLWECRQFLSTQNKPSTKTRRARGDFPLVIDRGWFHYLERIKKKVQVYYNNSNKTKNVSAARPGKVYVWETLKLSKSLKISRKSLLSNAGACLLSSLKPRPLAETTPTHGKAPISLNCQYRYKLNGCY